MTERDREARLECPLPLAEDETIRLAHGGGGTRTRALVQGVFRAAFDDPELTADHDGAVLGLGAERIAFTTDSYVVRPLFFPGGDIGTLAVHGTVNDLAMCGAEPIALSVGFVLEEGLAVADLRRVAASMASAAAHAGVRIVTGDTKVVDRGKGDGIYVNTAGLGRVVARAPILPTSVRPGDRILLSGDVGRHGIAIMGVREGLAFETPVESDVAPLHRPVLALLAAGIEVHCLRDLTRGGLAAALNEIAATGGVELVIDEEAVAVREDVEGACEILGLDPFYVACEGRFAAFVPASEVAAALAILRAHDETASVCEIGEVAPLGESRPRVLLRTRIGSTRVLDWLSGEQLPRIC